MKMLPIELLHNPGFSDHHIYKIMKIYCVQYISTSYIILLHYYYPIHYALLILIHLQGYPGCYSSSICVIAPPVSAVLENLLLYLVMHYSHCPIPLGIFMSHALRLQGDLSPPPPLVSVFLHEPAPLSTNT